MEGRWTYRRSDKGEKRGRDGKREDGGREGEEEGGEQWEGRWGESDKEEEGNCMKMICGSPG